MKFTKSATIAPVVGNVIMLVDAIYFRSDADLGFD